MCSKLGNDNVQNRDSRLYKTIITINHVCLCEARWGKSPPRVKDPNFILGQTYVSSDESSRKCQKACKACDETPEIRNPNKYTGFDEIQMNIGELSNRLSHWVKHQ